MSVQLGDKVKDRISGFTGIVTADYKYLNGCHRYQVDPDHLDKDEKVIEGKVFDGEQLVVVQAGVVAPMTPTGGPMDTPSRRNPPAR